MARPYQILLPLLSLFLVRVDLTDLIPLKIPVKILKIYDGDTVTVRYGTRTTKVRLSKVDAPEMGQPFLSGRGDAGAASRSCLLKLLRVGETEELRYEKSDMYGRILGDVGGVNFKLIEAGCADLYPHAVFASEREKFRYLRARTRARHEHRGIWNSAGFRQPKLWRKFSKRSSRRRWRR